MLADFIDKLVDKLKTCAPAGVGQPSKSMDGAPPRYTLVPRDVTHTPGGGSAKTLDGSAQCELLADDEHGVDVFCWGADMRACERLRQALLTVCESEFADNVVANDDKSEWVTEALGSRGLMLVVRLTFKEGLPFAVIPANLGDPIVDRTDDLVTIEGVGFDTSPGTPGDGVLTPGDP